MILFVLSAEGIGEEIDAEEEGIDDDEIDEIDDYDEEMEEDGERREDSMVFINSL